MKTVKRSFIFISLLGLTSVCLGFQNISPSTSNKAQTPLATTAETKLSFGDIPELKEAFISTSPNERNDGIPVGQLGTYGGNKEMILKLAQDIAVDKHGNFDSFLIAHDGKLVFESYYRRGRVNLPHPQASATKSYTSLALGRAIQLGYLTMADLHKPLISFLKDLDPSRMVDGVEKITLHKALTMRSGIQLTSEQREELEKDPSQLKGQGQVQTFLEHSESITDASQVFAYKDDPRLVMQVIEAVVPGTAQDFIKNELLDKMGIANYVWETDINGLPSSGNGTSMTSRDMIKWGTLAMNKGKWNGEQLVPAVFVSKSTSKIVDQSEEYDDSAKGVSGTAYGYFFWQADFSVGNKSFLAKSARGGSGQNIYVIEDLDLVVVTTTHRPVDSSVAVTAERVIPAFVKSNASIDPFLGQTPPGLTAIPFATGKRSMEGWVLGGNFGPDSDEFYMVNRHQGGYSAQVVVFRKEGRNWTKHDFLQTHTTDSNRLYRRNQYIERTETGWSKMKSIGPMFEREDWGIMRVTASKKGTYVFDDYKSNDVIRISRIKDGKREAPELLGEHINVGKWTAHPNIAPDESYLIWDSERDDGYGDSDIYVTFKQPDGSWGEAINLGDKVNTAHADFSSWITPNGKYLFFWRTEEKTNADGTTYRDSGKYWVSTQVIENLRPKNQGK